MYAFVYAFRATPLDDSLFRRIFGAVETPKKMKKRGKKKEKGRKKRKKGRKKRRNGRKRRKKRRKGKEGKKWKKGRGRTRLKWAV